MVGMAKSPGESKRNQPEIELVDDAWPRFERFIREVAKAGPQHRKSQGKRPKPAKTGRRGF